jgi:hypothetical protein
MFATGFQEQVTVASDASDKTKMIVKMAIAKKIGLEGDFFEGLAMIYDVPDPAQRRNFVQILPLLEAGRIVVNHDVAIVFLPFNGEVDEARRQRREGHVLELLQAPDLGVTDRFCNRVEPRFRKVEVGEYRLTFPATQPPNQEAIQKLMEAANKV